MIKDHCVENDIIDQVEEKPTTENVEILRLKLDFKHEERQLELEEPQRAHDAEKAAHKKARELRLAELKEALKCAN